MSLNWVLKAWVSNVRLPGRIDLTFRNPTKSVKVLFFPLEMTDLSLYSGMMAVRRKILVSLIAITLSISGFSQSNKDALALFQQGEEISKKNPEKAYPVFVKAMTLARQNGDWDTYINALNHSSTLAIAEKGDFDKSFDASKEALTFVDKFKSRAAVAELHYNIGEFYYWKNGTDTALHYYNNAKQIFVSLNGEFTKEVAKCYHGLGDVNKYNKLDFYEAEVNYEKALSIRERIGFNDTLVLYKNFYSLATTNRSQQDFEKALSYGSKAMDFAKDLDPLRVETTTAVVASIYRDMNESQMAKKYYLEAIALNKKTNDRDNRAWYFLGLGIVYKKDSLYQDALKCFNQAYPFYRSSETETYLFHYLLLQTQQVYNALKDDARFLKTTRELFHSLSQRNEDHGHFMSQGMRAIGDFYNDRKNYDSALSYYQRALVALLPSFKSLNVEDNPAEGELGFFYYGYEVLVEKASALTGKFNASNNPSYLIQSISCLRLAERLISKQRSTLEMDKSKWEFLDSAYDLYEAIISQLIEGKRLLPKDSINDLAFRYLELSKSRSLADALAEAEQTKRISSNDSLLRIHIELRRELLGVQNTINEELEKKSSPDVITHLREQIVNVDRRIQNCKQAIEFKYPGYFNVKYGYDIPTLNDVRRVLKDRGQVALEFFWGSEWVYAIFISDDNIMFERIGRPDSIGIAIAAVVKHFDETASGLDPRTYESFVTNAHELYKKLVEPFASAMKGHPRILIIPDGPINQVPFEILLEEPARVSTVDYRSLHYLIKTTSVGYAYSSVMLMRASEPVKRPSLLAVGFTGGSRLRAPQPELEEIVGAEEELEALAKRFSRGKFLVGPDATEANFKVFSPQYDIIHLAIHGRGDVQSSFSSSLYFRSKYDSLDDGELHDYELYGLKLKALMAVLSACESGLGRDYKGEGMISMASAFTYSGCGNILMSLWKVNDKASTVLMDDFYGHLLENKTIDDALRNAKLDYLESTDELTSDPRVWAPLVAYGSLEPIFKKSNDRVVIYGAIGAFLLLAIIFISRRRRSI